MDAMFHLKNDHAAPVSGCRILRAEESEALLNAQALITAARERAAAILHDAEAVYVSRKEEGYQEGLRQGRLMQAEKMMESALSSVNFIENIEKSLVEVVTQATRKIIGDLDDDERIVRVVRTALRQVRDQQRVVLHLCPADEPAVTQALASLLPARPGASSFLTILPDARMERGACLLESELGMVDAGLDTQLTALEQALRSKIEQNA